MTCPVGWLLSYSFMAHDIEDRTDTCVTPNKCVDYLHVTFPGDEEVTCGQEPPLNTVFADGYSEFKVEFYANRYEEAAGFLMIVTCFPPPIPPPMCRGKRQTAESEECSRVSDAARPTADGGAQLVSFIAIS